MANIKQQKKRVLTNEIRRQRNVATRTRMRTFVKRADAAIDSGDAKLIGETVALALSEIDRAAGNGVIHARSAARKKSSLQRRAAAKS